MLRERHIVSSLLGDSNVRSRIGPCKSRAVMVDTDSIRIRALMVSLGNSDRSMRKVNNAVRSYGNNP